MSKLSDISNCLKDLEWLEKKGNFESVVSELPLKSELFKLPNLPMNEELRQLVESSPDIWKHIRGVIANVNELISGSFSLRQLEETHRYDIVETDLADHRKFCLIPRTGTHRNTVIQDIDEERFAKDFLRVAALYHDIGKIISPDRHVSRGVHLMRDVNDEYRISFEQKLMEGCFEDIHNFWALLSHHDTFGVLVTGEASLAALSQMVSWSGDHNGVKAYKSPAALVSYLLLLNLADADSSLRFVSPLDGLGTVEAGRYLEDWKVVKDLLWDDKTTSSKSVPREKFVESLLSYAIHPERTIERITRIVTTSYRMKVSNDFQLDESEVKKLVEDELDMLHGAKFRLFCDLFARFCKIDYGRRFFDVIMLFELLDKQHGLLERVGDSPEYEYPNYTRPIEGLSPEEKDRRRSNCLKEMTCRICSILKRFMDDYGDSVKGDPHSAPLMCIVMANLMPESEKKTAWAICRALKEHESRALAWISEEVSVSPYIG